MALLKQISSLRTLQSGTFRALFSAQAATQTDSKYYDVPEGHAQNDLSQATCNIGLNRRRDLKLGGPAGIKLFVDGKSQLLPDLLKVQKCIFIFSHRHRHSF